MASFLLLVSLLVTSLIGFATTRPTLSPPFSFSNKIHSIALRSRDVPKKITLSHTHRPVFFKRDFPTADLNVMSVGAFSAEITIGSQNFAMFIDTGSSINWLPTFNISCWNPTMSNVSYLAPAACGFNNTMSLENQEASFLPLLPPNSTIAFPFHVDYGGGRYIAGSLGHIGMSIAGMDVPNVELGLGLYTSITPSYGADGILGLAFGNTGNNGIASLTDTIFSDNLTDPYLSMALCRGDNDGAYGGSMMFGSMLDSGAPDVNSTGSPLLEVEMLTCGPDGCGSNPADPYTFFAINVAAIITDDTLETAVPTNSTEQAFLLDSGTTFNILPPDLAAAINSRIYPPAVQVITPSIPLYWIAPCNATSARVGFQIRETIFYMNPVDMINQNYHFNATHCVCGNQNQNSYGSMGILGSTFLKNVLVTFDVRDHLVLLQSREWYTTDPAPFMFEDAPLNGSEAHAIWGNAIPTESLISSPQPPSSAQALSSTPGPYALQLHRRRRNCDLDPSLPLSLGDHDQIFSTTLTIGTQNFSFLIDTGSAGTWLGTTNINCLNGDVKASCNFSSQPLHPSNAAAASFQPPTAGTVLITLQYSDGSTIVGTLKTTNIAVPTTTLSILHSVVIVEAATPNISHGLDGLLGLATSPSPSSSTPTSSSTSFPRPPPGSSTQSGRPAPTPTTTRSGWRHADPPPRSRSSG